ncbi:MAG: zinc-binding dehydrogenase [Chloroflexi bacterium]|nr:zinc-binding dehydrogenase [Chloroflexota bacterium]
MKAMVYTEFGGPEVQKWVDVPDPKACPNDVVIKVHAAALNYNDIHARRGFPMEVILPHISGSDVSGVVVDRGGEVRDIKVGDEVIVHCGESCRACAACTRGEEIFCRNFKIWGFQTGPLDGAYGEYIKIPAVQAIPKPKNLSHVDASSLGLILVTVWRQLVKRGGIRPGDNVVIWGGAGGLGTMAIQVTKLFNATAIAIAQSDEKLAFCRELGADYVINRKTQDVAAEVRKITNRAGADIVFEHPGKQTIDASLRMVKWGGTVVTSGATSGHDAQVDLRHIFFRQVSLIGSTLGSKADLVEALKHVESGLIKPVVSRTWAMNELNEAQAVMESDEALGKLVVAP